MGGAPLAGLAPASAGRRFRRQHGLDRRIRPFELHRELCHFGGDVVDALAQQRIFHALGRPGAFGLLLDRVDVALQLGAFVARDAELFLDRGLFGAQFFDRRRLPPPFSARSRRAIPCGAFRGFVGLRSWLFSYSRSASSLPCVASGASRSLTRLPSISASLTCSDQLAVEIGDALAQILDRLRASASSRVAFSDSPRSCSSRACVVGKFLFGVADAALQFVDLGAHRDQLDLAALRHHRTVGQFVIEFGKLACLSISACSAPRSDSVLAANSSSVARSCSFTAFSRASSEKIVAFFSPSSIFMRLIASDLLAEFGELAGGLVLELVDAHLEPPRRHREFRAQLVLVGLDFGHRQRRRRLQPLGRQPHRAVMHQRHDHQPEQHRDQKTDRQIHDRFDHEAYSPHRKNSLITMPWRGG
jgi:hypothetical protein